MRKLTEQDLGKLVGSKESGYRVENARIKNGPFVDSDHYGFILGKNNAGQYVTWQFHLLEDGSVTVYWGHYFMEDRDSAMRDFYSRDTPSPSQRFKVTITETLKMTVEVEAEDKYEAEQMVSDNWRKSQYILDADNFVGVTFEAPPVVDGEEKEDENGQGYTFIKRMPSLQK